MEAYGLSADFIRIAHRTNGAIAFVCGLCANLLVVSMVASSSLGKYKRLLLQMTFVDGTFLVLAGVVDPIILLFDGTEVVLQNSVLRYLPQPWNGYLVSAWVFGIYFTVFSICVQFLFRYQILCKQQEVSNVVLVTMLMIPMAVAVGIGVLFQCAFVYEPEEEELVTHLLGAILLESGDTNIHPSSIARKGNTKLLLLITVAFVCMAANYLIIVFCVRRINATLTALSPNLKPGTRALHTQLSKILFVQAISPLVVSIVPLLFLFWCIVSRGTAFLSLMLLTTGFSWIPCVNACVTLFFVTQFRRRLMRYLCCCGGAVEPGSTQTRLDSSFRNNTEPSAIKEPSVDVEAICEF